MAGQEEQSEHATLEEVIAIVRRRLWVIVLCTVVAAGAAVGFSLTRTTQYTASASLLFRDSGLNLLGTSLQAGGDPARDAATNVQLVALPAVARRAARVLGGDLTAGVVQGRVDVSAQGQSDLVTVEATDPRPATAARIANVYATQYVAFRREADRAKIAAARTLVQRQLAQRSAAEGEAGADDPATKALAAQDSQLANLEALQTGNAELVERAVPPQSPSSPRPTRNGVLGGVLGLLLGLGLAFLIDRLDRRVRDIEEFERLFAMPLLGSVPRMPTAEVEGPAGALAPVDAEAFALIRARLRYFNVDGAKRTMLVTSAAPGDGKSTVARNLAAAEAAIGSGNVLLLEADLRRPTLAARSGVPSPAGLAEVLSHGATLDQVIVPVLLSGPHGGSGDRTLQWLGPKFDLLAAGLVPPNPAELLASQAMQDLLGELRHRYELVIIDTPPTLAVSDAVPLLRAVDGVIVVARERETHRDVAQHLQKQLVALGAPTLGVVANGVRAKRTGYGYGYGAATAAAAPDVAPSVDARGSRRSRRKLVRRFDGNSS